MTSRSALRKKIELEKRLSSLVRVLTAKKIPVVYRGTQPMVCWNKITLEPEMVVLTAIPDEPSDQFIRVLEGFLDHEGAHLMYSDPHMVKESVERKAAFIFNVVDDIYIERRIVADFPGSERNLQNVRDIFTSDFIEPRFKELSMNADKATLRDWWGLLCVAALRAKAGHHPIDEYMEDKWHLIQPVMDEIEPLIPQLTETSSPAECLDLSLQLRRKINKALKDSEREPEREPTPPTPPSPPSEESDEPSPPSDDTFDDEQESPEHEPGDDADDDRPEESDGDSSDEDDDQEESESDEESSEAPSCEDSEPSDDDDEPEEGFDESESDEDEDGDGESGEDDAGEDDLGDEDETDEDDAGEPGDEDGADDDDSDESGGGMEGDAENEDEAAFDDTGGHDPADLEAAEPPEYTDEELDEELEGVEFDDAIEASVKKEAEKALEAGAYMPYTTEKDRIEPAPIEQFQGREVENLATLANEAAGDGRRQLMRIIRGKNAVSFQRGLRRGRIDSSSLHRLFANDDRLFKRKATAEDKSVAIQLVVDCSASMNGGRDWMWSGEKPPNLEEVRSKIHLAALSAWTFAQTLDLLNVPCEVVGFTTDYQERVDDYWGIERRKGENPGFSRYESLYLPVFKSFDEKFGPNQRARIASLLCPDDYFLCENVDGESLRILSTRLLERKEDKKVMIVFSDGQPCSGFSDNWMLRNHLKKVTREISSEGINLVGVGIMSDSVKDYYDKAVVLKDARDLPKTTIREVSDAILS